MDISVLTNFFTALMMVIGVLVVLTNIIVEVVKKLTGDKLPTNILAILVALVLTVVAFFAWASYSGIAVMWYYVAGAVILGCLVAYAAMFGFDKLKEALAKIQDMSK